jgi:hypothetical protein
MYKIYQKSVFGVSVLFFISVFSQDNNDIGRNYWKIRKNFNQKLLKKKSKQKQEVERLKSLGILSLSAKMEMINN